MSDAAAPADAFVALRPLLLGVAYRMLGSAADAEDVVQDAFLRWQRVDASGVGSPRAFLTTMVTRMSIDRLRSARARRESYKGPWLPEPVAVDDGAVDHAGTGLSGAGLSGTGLPGTAVAAGRLEADPAAGAELADSLSLAFLVLLEELGPVERAVFLLREVFAFPYDEIAEMTGQTPENCRQMLHRARRRVGERRRRFETDRARADALAERFLVACGAGDLPGLMALLADDVVVWTDGGGKAKAAPRPVVGPWRAARFLVHTAKGIPAGAVRRATLNGQPGILVDEGGVVTTAIVLDIADGSIVGVRVVANPDKLRAVQPGAGRFPALP